MVSLTPYQVAALRMFSAGIILLPYAINAIRKVPRNKMGIIILSGFLGSFFPAFLFCIAETRIDSSLAGILNALTPLFTLLIGVLFYNMTVSRDKYLGIVIGFVGLVLLFVAGGNIDLGYISFALMVLLATIFYGINVNVVSQYLLAVGPINIASIALSFLMFPSLAVLWISGYFRQSLIQPALLKATVASCLLGLMGTAIASIIFYVLVKRAGGLFASTVTYGIPFVAVFWGLLSGEVFTAVQLGCLLLILAGVYLANRVVKPAAAVAK